MYTLIRTLGRQSFVRQQLPSVGAAMVVAELFYKFHSFTFECLAFVATWAAFDALATNWRGAAARTNAGGGTVLGK